MDNSDPAREIQALAASILALASSATDWLARVRAVAGVSREALENAISRGDVNVPPSTTGDAERLALLLLLTKPNSAVVALLRTVARDSFRRFDTALAPYIDEGDLLSILRWRLWERPPTLSGPWSFRSFVRTVARSLAIDHARAVGRHAPTSTDGRYPLDELVDSAPRADDRVDYFQLLSELDRIASTIPDGSILLGVLLEELDHNSALGEINARRTRRGEEALTPEGLRSALYRLRRALRGAADPP